MRPFRLNILDLYQLEVIVIIVKDGEVSRHNFLFLGKEDHRVFSHFGGEKTEKNLWDLLMASRKLVPVRKAIEISGTGLTVFLRIIMSGGVLENVAFLLTSISFIYCVKLSKVKIEDGFYVTGLSNLIFFVDL